MRNFRFLALVLCLASAASATTPDEVMKALQEKITVTKVNTWSGSIASPGTELVVQKAGLVAGDPDTLNKTTVVTNGELTRAGGGVLGGSFFSNGSAGHELKVGDRIYISEIRALQKNAGFMIRIMTVGTYDVVKHGTTKSEHGLSSIAFTYDPSLDSMDAAAAVAEFAKWFKTDTEASESRTVKLGQTPAEVEAILGAPDKRIDLGPKKVYVYKDMKIVFTNGQVADVQ